MFYGYMAQRVCQDIHDLVRHGGCLVARCQCGRVAIFSIGMLSERFKAKRWPADTRSVGARLRCAGCGRRGVKVGYNQTSTSAVGGGMSIAFRPWQGVDPVDWVNTDDAGRKRMLARARMTADRKLWFTAAAVLHKHGAGAQDHVEQQVLEMANALDQDGLRDWLAIADRVDRLSAYSRKGKRLH